VKLKMELPAEVAVPHDLPEKGLVRGEVGTIVELLSPSVAEVEFGDDQGRTYARAALRSEEMIRLHHLGVGSHDDLCDGLTTLLQGFMNQGVELPKIHWIDG
jgi:hypothetical protein